MDQQRYHKGKTITSHSITEVTVSARRTAAMLEAVTVLCSRSTTAEGQLLFL